MTEELTYLNMCVREPEKTMKFLTLHFGFFNNRGLSEIDKPAKQGFLIGNKFGNNYFIPLQSKSDSQAVSFNKPIVINTDDCLRDYHHLRVAGINFEGMPRYTPNGLEVVISDKNGNRYTLLEKRDYSAEL
ncbi:hypothetical protein BH09BAC6_BH09BAC6_36140 [soil metagenome]